MKRWWWLFAAAVLFALAGVGIGFALSDEDEPVSNGGGGGHARDSGDLHDARADAARRAGVPILEVRLIELRNAGFDGCLGVIDPLALCTEIFISGHIAIFEVDGAQYRYHFGGGEWVGPLDPGEAGDGFPVPAEMRSDLNRLLAEYVRQEFAVRSGQDVEDVVIAWIAPTTFGNACLGYQTDGENCSAKGPLTQGALVRLSSPDGNAVYSVSERGVRFHDPEGGRSLVEADVDLIKPQSEIRNDLAERLGAELGEVSVTSFRLVTWPNGCLGVEKPEATCLAALTDGFLATVAGPDGTEYRYHGSSDGFWIAASFETGATITEPLPPE
jgi:hypothetical protein